MPLKYRFSLLSLFILSSANAANIADQEPHCRNAMACTELKGQVDKEYEKLRAGEPWYVGDQKFLRDRQGQPIMNLTWYEARAACEQLGYRLPTLRELLTDAVKSGAVFLEIDQVPQDELQEAQGAIHSGEHYMVGRDPYLRYYEMHGETDSDRFFYGISAPALKPPYVQQSYEPQGDIGKYLVWSSDLYMGRSNIFFDGRFGHPNSAWHGTHSSKGYKDDQPIAARCFEK